MSTPHGMKCDTRTLATGDKVHIYSDATHIILQLRHQVPSEENLLGPSFKVAVSLTPAEAIGIASELLDVALPQLNQLLATATFPVGDLLPLSGGNDNSIKSR
jgi:hypothetical protein